MKEMMKRLFGLTETSSRGTAEQAQETTDRSRASASPCPEDRAGTASASPSIIVAMPPPPVLSLSQTRHHSPVGRPFSLSRIPVLTPSPDRHGRHESADGTPQRSPQRSARKACRSPPAEPFCVPSTDESSSSDALATCPLSTNLSTSTRSSQHPPATQRTIPIIRQGHYLEMLSRGMASWMDSEHVATTRHHHDGPVTDVEHQSVEHSNHQSITTLNHRTTAEGQHVHPIGSSSVVPTLRRPDALRRTDDEVCPLFATPRDPPASQLRPPHAHEDLEKRGAAFTRMATTTRRPAHQDPTARAVTAAALGKTAGVVKPLPRGSSASKAVREPPPVTATMLHRAAATSSAHTMSAEVPSNCSSGSRCTTINEKHLKIAPRNASVVPPPPAAPVSRTSSAVRSTSATRPTSATRRAKSPMHLSPNEFAREFVQPPQCPGRVAAVASRSTAMQDRRVSPAVSRCTSQSKKCVASSSSLLSGNSTLEGPNEIGVKRPVAVVSRNATARPSSSDSGNLSDVLEHYQDMVSQLTDMYYRSRVGVRAAVTGANASLAASKGSHRPQTIHAATGV